jgi:hypothetical protein
MHVASLAVWIVVVPIGVTVLLGLCNPPCCWTGMVGPSLPGFTIARCLSFKTIPKSEVCVCIYTIAFELSYMSLG